MGRRKATPSRERMGSKGPAATKIVKSANRVIEILEFFDDRQREASVMEVSESLGFPQSSTSALLRSLVAMGYLNYDARKRTYVTSSRVALLGSWVNWPFFAEGTIISLMKDLNEQTRDTIVLAMRNGLYVQYIHVLQATNPARLHMTLGTVRPLAGSGAGFAILSTMTDAEVTRIVMRINAEARPGEPLIRLRDLLTTLSDVRRKGYAFTCDMVTPGGGMLAAPLPGMAGQPQMVVGIGGISEVMRGREDKLAEALLGQIDDRFGAHMRQFAARGEIISDPLPLAMMRAQMRGGR